MDVDPKSYALAEIIQRTNKTKQLDLTMNKFKRIV